MHELSTPGEDDRICDHLTRVEADLRTSGDSHGARRASLDALADYIERGEFPRNTYAPGRTPVFVDAAGHRCAVAYLLHATGCDDLVAAVSATQNLARVPDIDAPGLADWADEHGLTLDELERIQPMYAPPPPDVRWLVAIALASMCFYIGFGIATRAASRTLQRIAATLLLIGVAAVSVAVALVVN